MKKYNDQSELVDLASLKKKKLPYVDIHTFEHGRSIIKNFMVRKCEIDWGTGEEREWYELAYSNPVWRISWYKVLAKPEKGYPEPEYECIDELKELEKYLKTQGITDFKDHTDYHSLVGYDRTKTFSTFITFQLLRVLEKKLGKEICFIYPRGYNYYIYPGYNEKYRWYDDKDADELKEIDSKIRIFFEDFTDPKDIFDDFIGIVDDFVENTEFGTLWNKNVTYDGEYKSVKPRAPKKNVEPSDEEKLSIAQSRLDEILCSTPDELLDFIKNKGLLDEFKNSFLEQYSKQSFTTISIDADVMFGDADGTHHQSFAMSFDEWDYLKEWWTAYRQKYPAKKDTFEMDHPIFGVGYQEAGEGAWKICAVDKLLEDKTVKVFDFDNGHSTVKMNVSKDEDAKFENRYEGITDKPVSSAHYEELPDMLDAYAAYWYAMDKKDEALIELPDIW